MKMKFSLDYLNDVLCDEDKKWRGELEKLSERDDN